VGLWSLLPGDLLKQLKQNRKEKSRQKSLDFPSMGRPPRGRWGDVCARLTRLPLDDFWPRVHLAPYAFSGLVAIFGGGTARINTSFPELNQRFNGGLEYRFTPHIGIFAEAGYDLVDHTNGRNGNNFVQTNFGLRFAF
jgi:hypothetical protein